MNDMESRKKVIKKDVDHIENDTHSVENDIHKIKKKFDDFKIEMEKLENLKQNVQKIVHEHPGDENIHESQSRLNKTKEIEVDQRNLRLEQEHSLKYDSEKLLQKRKEQMDGFQNDILDKDQQQSKHKERIRELESERETFLQKMKFLNNTIKTPVEQDAQSPRSMEINSLISTLIDKNVVMGKNVPMYHDEENKADYYNLLELDEDIRQKKFKKNRIENEVAEIAKNLKDINNQNKANEMLKDNIKKNDLPYNNRESEVISLRKKELEKLKESTEKTRIKKQQIEDVHKEEIRSKQLMFQESENLAKKRYESLCEEHQDLIDKLQYLEHTVRRGGNQNPYLPTETEVNDSNPGTDLSRSNHTEERSSEYEVNYAKPNNPYNYSRNDKNYDSQPRTQKY